MRSIFAELSFAAKSKNIYLSVREVIYALLQTLEADGSIVLFLLAVKNRRIINMETELIRKDFNFNILSIEIMRILFF